MSCTLRNLTPRCHAPEESGYLVVNKILIKTSLLGVILQCHAHQEVVLRGVMQTEESDSAVRCKQGLGIHSLVFHANCSFFESKRAKMWFTLFKV